MGLRIKASEQYHDIQYGDRIVLAGGSLDLRDKKDVRAFAVEMKSQGPFAMVVIDTTAQATPGANENGGEDMSVALDACKTLHRATGAMTLLVSHTGKDATKGVRGWSGQRAAMDVQLEVQHDPNTQQRAVLVEKLKDGREGAKWAFKLGVVTLGLDAHGDELSSCVATCAGDAPAANAADAWRGQGVNQAAVEQALRQLWAHHRNPLSMEAITKTAIQIRVQESKGAAGPGVARTTATNGISKAITALFKTQMLIADENGLITAPLLPLPPVQDVAEGAKVPDL